MGGLPPPPPGHQATRDAASEGGSSGSRRGSWAWWGRQAEPQPESALCRMADCLEDSWGQKPLSASLLGRGAGRPWERPLFPGRRSLAWERHLTPALAEGSAFSPAPTGAAGRSGLEAGPGGLDWPLRTVTPLLSAPHPHASPPLNPASVRSRGPHRDGEGQGAGSRLLSLRACSVTGDPPTPRHFQQPWVGSGGCLPEVCFPRWCRGRVRRAGLLASGEMVSFFTLQSPATLSERGAPGQRPERLRKLPQTPLPHGHPALSTARHARASPRAPPQSRQLLGTWL